MTLDVAEKHIGAGGELCFELAICAGFQFGDFAHALQLFLVDAVFAGDNVDFLIGGFEFHQNHFVLFRHGVIMDVEGCLTGLDSGLVQGERHGATGFAAFNDLDDGCRIALRRHHQDSGGGECGAYVFHVMTFPR